METLAAARDLGTWAAPTRPSPRESGVDTNKENMATAAAAVAAPFPRYSVDTPLAEIPNGGGRGGRPYADRYPSFAAAAAAAAACRGYHGVGGAKGINGGGGGGGGSSGKQRAGGGRARYQRSNSDVGAQQQHHQQQYRGVFVAVPPPSRGTGRTTAGTYACRPGIGGGGDAGGDGKRRGVGGYVSAAAADDMHLAAVAMARARRGRISSRY